MKDYQRDSISNVIDKINKSIFLPDIQRPFVWEEEQIYKLFDSLMREYPISTFLFWELTKDKIEQMETTQKFVLKKYCFVDNNKSESNEDHSRNRDTYQFVLDGQQRLTSLYIALTGSWRKKVRKQEVQMELYFDLLSGLEENDNGIRYDFRFIKGRSVLPL